MREILFRGKRTDNGEWVEGFYVEDPFCVSYEICDVNSATYHREDVDPSTVGQYTGIKDKNGKRIFEWDIIHTSRDGGRTYVVIYDDDLCAFVGRVYESNIFVTFEGDGEQYKVIGNIHDNPELMDGGAE